MSICPSCGSPTSKAVYRGRTVNGFGLRRCDRCRLVYASPRPTPEALADFYRTGYWGGERAGYGYTDMSVAFEAAQHQWAAALKLVGDLLPRHGRLLDIGCGSGGFLAAARDHGWDVHGTDLAHDAAEAVRSRGITVTAGALLPPEDTGQFDLVSMWHVAEHVIDVREALAGARTFIAPTGLLLIEVPSWASVGRVVRGLEWRQLKPPEHLNYFTPNALRHALVSNGFTIERLITTYPYAQHRASRLPTPFRQAGDLVIRAACRSGFGGTLRVAARVR